MSALISARLMTPKEKAQTLYAQEYSIRQIAELLRETTHCVTRWVFGQHTRRYRNGWFHRVDRIERHKEIPRRSIPKAITYSMDSGGYEDRDWYDAQDSGAKTPLELLMEKEEAGL